MFHEYLYHITGLWNSTIVDILRLCYFKCVLDRKEIETLISKIEDKDRTRITRVEEIFDNDVC